MMIKNGFQEMIICGGAQETNKYSMASFDGLGVFSVREMNPQKHPDLLIKTETA
jgi:3-oxoacyl-[acyl-carrier-protein] synthase-1